MAKSKSFFGLRTGSTKTLTFQVYRGEQITKDRVYRVSNPRTQAQMKQRAIIPIVAAARSALKGPVDHSFEGVPYGEASLKEFSKQNLRAGALSVTSYSPNGVSNPGFANLIVSNGSINVPYLIASTRNGSTVRSFDRSFPPFKFPKADEGASADVILKYLETYARTANVDIIAPGTQLTFLSIFQDGSVDINTGSGKLTAPTSGFAINRIYIPNGDSDSANAKEVNDQWKVEDAVAQDDNHATLINNNGDKIVFKCDENDTIGDINITIIPKIISGIHINNCGLALILSRYVNGIWKRSKSRLVVGAAPDPQYSIDTWLSVYQTTGAASKKYLNTGDEGPGIQGWH